MEHLQLRLHTCSSASMWNICSSASNRSKAWTQREPAHRRGHNGPCISRPPEWSRSHLPSDPHNAASEWRRRTLEDKSTQETRREALGSEGLSPFQRPAARRRSTRPSSSSQQAGPQGIGPGQDPQGRGPGQDNQGRGPGQDNKGRGQGKGAQDREPRTGPPGQGPQAGPPRQDNKGRGQGKGAQGRGPGQDPQSREAQCHGAVGAGFPPPWHKPLSSGWVGGVGRTPGSWGAADRQRPSRQPVPVPSRATAQQRK
ncbi:unnamed protein product [Boreogadus saida]